jgi:hypothetical protein
MWIVILAAAALAAPIDLPHQGRLVDTAGSPISGTHDVTVRLYAGSTLLSTQTFDDVSFDQGYYAVRLTNVDANWLASGVDLGLALDGGAEWTPRQELASAPRARYADVAGGARAQVAGVGTACTTAGGFAWDTGAGAAMVCNGSIWLRLTTSGGGGLVTYSGTSRRWADGTFAASCNDYKNPTGGYSYTGQTGSGTYHIKPTSGAEYPVYCDMSTDNGGWTLITSNQPQPSVDIAYSTFSGTSVTQEYGSGVNVVSRARFEVPLTRVMFKHPGGTTYAQVGATANLLALPANTAFSLSGSQFPNTTYSGAGSVSTTVLYYKKTPAASHRNYIWSKYDVNSLNQDGMWCWSGPYCSGGEYAGGTSGGQWEIYVR